MDDILLMGDLVKMMTKEVDSGLSLANFNIPEWTVTGDKKQVKFLSYMYDASTDTFSVRPKVNWSPKKRGVRQAADVKTISELQQHAEKYGMTKRSVASLVIGSLHDPLGFMQPFQSNLKLHFRDICRLKLQ